MSVTVLIINPKEDLLRLKAAFDASYAIQTYADIHLYYYDRADNGEDLSHEDELRQADLTTFKQQFDGEKMVINENRSDYGLFPANLMRNMAIEGARTDWVMTSEVNPNPNPIPSPNPNPNLNRDMSLKVDLAFSPQAASKFKVLVKSLQSKTSTESQSQLNGAYVVPLLQWKAGSCAGTSDDGARNPLISGARDLPKDPRSFGLGLGSKTKDELTGCLYDSHAFMDYKLWMRGFERHGAPRPLPPQEFRPLERLQARDAQQAGFEPYFIANKRKLPKFEDGIVFCTNDKMDQIRRMQDLRFLFYAVPDVYLFHLDVDDVANKALREAQKKVDPSGPDLTKPGTTQHSGRLFCDVQEVGSQFAVTLLPAMRKYQWQMSWVSRYQRHKGGVDTASVQQVFPPTLHGYQDD